MTAPRAGSGTDQTSQVGTPGSASGRRCGSARSPRVSLRMSRGGRGTEWGATTPARRCWLYDSEDAALYRGARPAFPKCEPVGGRGERPAGGGLRPATGQCSRCASGRYRFLSRSWRGFRIWATPRVAYQTPWRLCRQLPGMVPGLHVRQRVFDAVADAFINGVEIGFQAGSWPPAGFR